MVVQSIVEADGEWAEFALNSRKIYQAIQQEQDISVKVTGSLYLASTETERAVLEEFREAYSTIYHCSYLSAHEALQRYPFIQESYCQGALFFPDDFTVEPRQLLSKCIPYITQKMPVEYVPQTTVIAVESNGKECIVKDAQGNVFKA